VGDHIFSSDDLVFNPFISPAILLDPELPEPNGLPPLDAGWSWFQFRFEQSTDQLPKGFMRTEIEDLD